MQKSRDTESNNHTQALYVFHHSTINSGNTKADKQNWGLRPVTVVSLFNTQPITDEVDHQFSYEYSLNWECWCSP